MLHRQLANGGLTSPGGRRCCQRPRSCVRRSRLLIFGGAGFVGSNLADAVMSDGEDVIVFDNLSRPGVERNLSWLASRHGADYTPSRATCAIPLPSKPPLRKPGSVVHLAAQVAVTSSLTDPLDDFTVNAQGTLTILEAIRRLAPQTPLVFASTNKVYGALTDLQMQRRPIDTYRSTRISAIAASTRPGRLSFCTPYGCSKGAADQYVLDYAHSSGFAPPFCAKAVSTGRASLAPKTRDGSRTS